MPCRATEAKRSQVAGLAAPGEPGREPPACAADGFPLDRTADHLAEAAPGPLKGRGPGVHVWRDPLAARLAHAA